MSKSRFKRSSPNEESRPVSGMKHYSVVNDTGVIAVVFYSSSDGFKGLVGSVLSNNLEVSSPIHKAYFLRRIKGTL